MILGAQHEISKDPPYKPMQNGELKWVSSKDCLFSILITTAPSYVLVLVVKMTLEWPCGWTWDFCWRSYDTILQTNLSISQHSMKVNLVLTLQSYSHQTVTIRPQICSSVTEEWLCGLPCLNKEISMERRHDSNMTWHGMSVYLNKYSIITANHFVNLL